MIQDYLKTLPQYLLPKQSLTHLAGLLANVHSPRIKNWLIKRFIRQYQVNMQEALEENPESYACFNDFFTRLLKSTCRPLAEADIVSPVDGTISEIGKINEGQIFQAKGHFYSVSELLSCDPVTSKRFAKGKFVTLYLSPKDYHRIHMPIDAELEKIIYIPGKLFSVQPSTVRVVPYLFSRNKRLVAFFKTHAGPMAMVLVGATIVGAIGTKWQGDVKCKGQKQVIDYQQENDSTTTVSKGEEMGYFKLGSTVVLLFADGEKLEWLDSLKPGQSICLGQALGTIHE